MTDTEYAYLKKRIHDVLGIDLDAYKSQQMRRRLATFVDRKDTGGVFRFARSLGQDRGIVKELKDMLTINVTEFFRDANQFEHLEAVVLPELLEDRSRLNIWAAGCSNGARSTTAQIIKNTVHNTSAISSVYTRSGQTSTLSSEPASVSGLPASMLASLIAACRKASQMKNPIPKTIIEMGTLSGFLMIDQKSASNALSA